MLQTLGSEKMKVSSKRNEDGASWWLHNGTLTATLPPSQYAVPVTKYDRKGYKPRPRQLLLLSNSAVIVEESKLKQRIDYKALKGQRATHKS